MSAVKQTYGEKVLIQVDDLKEGSGRYFLNRVTSMTLDYILLICLFIFNFFI
jgi:hypothetical protein